MLVLTSTLYLYLLLICKIPIIVLFCYIIYMCVIIYVQCTSYMCRTCPKITECGLLHPQSECQRHSMINKSLRQAAQGNSIHVGSSFMHTPEHTLHGERRPLRISSSIHHQPGPLNLMFKNRMLVKLYIIFYL